MRPVVDCLLRTLSLTFLDGDAGTDSVPADAAEVHDDEWLDDRRLAVRHELSENEYGRLT